MPFSKRAKDYHSGRGVYRSSAKNALRLAATETNIAYRSADHANAVASPWVVGVRVVLSNNHTYKDCKGKRRPLTDICDTLAGNYPKGFKFTGWHPNCRCHVEYILKTPAEVQADTRRMLRGEQPIEANASKNYVAKLPSAFTGWIEDNSDRLNRAKTKPYFIQDNAKYINPIQESTGGYNGFTGQSILSSREATKKGIQAYKKYDSTTVLSKEVRKNSEELQKLFTGKSSIKPRDFIDADSGLPNKINGIENCVNTAVAHEFLRRGVDVTATDKYVENVANDNIQSLFMNNRKKHCSMQNIAGKSEDEFSKKLLKEINVKNGRYIIAYNTRASIEQYKRGYIAKEQVQGHVVSAEVTPFGVVFYDHQANCFVSINALLSNADFKDGIDILRIDNKIIDLSNPYIRDMFRPI